MLQEEAERQDGLSHWWESTVLLGAGSLDDRAGMYTVIWIEINENTEG